MKKFSFALLTLSLITSLMVFQNCGGEDKETAKQVTENILKSKEWTVSSVTVPVNSATQDDDWVSFKVSFNGTSMTTSGHPTGATAVWPSGSYTVSEDGKSLTRTSDGVVMALNPITATNFTARFTVPDGTDIGARIAELGGGYTFNMK